MVIVYESTSINHIMNDTDSELLPEETVNQLELTSGERVTSTLRI